MYNKGLEQKTLDLDNQDFKVRIEVRIKNAELVEAREKFCITQTEAAKKIGISQGILWATESLKHYPGEEVQDKICNFYGLSKDEVFPDKLKYVAKYHPRKFVAERYIPLENIISLTAVDQNLLPSHCTIDEAIEKAECEKVTSELLGILTPKQRKIIEYRFGINNKHPHTLEETAKKMRYNDREIVRQIEIKALRIMNDYAYKKGIKSIDLY